MYLTPTDKHWVVDIEADGLDPTRVWVLVAWNAVTKEERVCETYEEIRRFIEDTRGCSFVFHNGISFDVPVLNRLVGARIPLSATVDTFILSSIYSPSIAGGHSLAAWGDRLGFKKQEHDEWDKYSPEMLVRCRSDVEITWNLFTRLTKRMRDIGFTERSAELRHKGWNIIRKQRKNGFFFNYEQAHKLFIELREKERQLKERIYERFPPTLQRVASYAKSRKADGSDNAQYLRHCQQFADVVRAGDGSYECFDFVEFNLGSPKQRIEKLLDLGWEPREFTEPSKTFPQGQPKPTDNGRLSPSLQQFADNSGIEEVELIAKWMFVNWLANQVNTWMEAYNEHTQCIHGNLWFANTLRYRSDHPNTQNIPSVRVDDNDNPLKGEEGWWTYEARDLWQTRDPNTRRLVGVDAKGIQLRILAHYLDDEGLKEACLSGDPHTANAKRMGLPSKRVAKTITYATMMGAGIPRIASEAGISEAEAKEVREVFFRQVPGLRPLIARLQKELRQTGRITLCDGSKILVSSPHMVIPYLLQGDESCIMTQAAIYVDEKVRARTLDVLKVGDIHDEWQSDVRQTHVDEYMGVCRESFERAGTSFNYNIPIECDAKEGLTWAETH
jgi:DNA polymerase-1